MENKLVTEIHEASTEDSKMVGTAVNAFLKHGQGDGVKTMSFAIAALAQTFLAMGGNASEGEAIGEIIKQGVITTLLAYKDLSRATHKIGGRG